MILNEILQHWKLTVTDIGLAVMQLQKCETDFEHGTFIYILYIKVICTNFEKTLFFLFVSVKCLFLIKHEYSEQTQLPVMSFTHE